jgi:hypothetical protein
LLKSDLRLDRWIFVYRNISMEIQKKKTEEELSVVLKKIERRGTASFIKEATRPFNEKWPPGRLSEGLDFFFFGRGAQMLHYTYTIYFIYFILYFSFDFSLPYSFFH